MNRLIGAAFLIAGTCIGAGMLGLPIKTAEAGIIPSIITMISICCVMSITALFLLEVTLWHDENTNLISMSHSTLGVIGSNIMWLVYLLFFYSLLSSYSSGGISIVNTQIAHNYFSSTTAAILFVLPFASMIYFGSKISDFCNRIFIIGLVLSYSFLLTYVASSEVKLSFDGSFNHAIYSMPLMVTSFGFHHLVPTIRKYLNSEEKKIKKAIALGSLIPLIIYIIWEYLIFNTVPIHGEHGLIALSQKANPGNALVDLFAKENPIVGTSVLFFSFFALVSSFIGVSLGVFDFLADGFNIKKDNKGRLLLTAATFIPPTIFSILYPNGFMMALRYGVIFSAILLIIYPALMVYKGRQTRYNTPISKNIMPIITIFFGLIIIFIEYIQ